MKMTNNVEGYDISIKVTTLDEVTTVAKTMKEAGFTDFSVTPRRPMASWDSDYRKKQTKRHNNFILGALYYSKAFNEKNAKTIEEILDIGTRNLPTGVRITADNEGIARRTMNLLATKILADKNKLVEYSDTEPKKFWLTSSGIESTRKFVESEDGE
jgi:hypothetical protein